MDRKPRGRPQQQLNIRCVCGQTHLLQPTPANLFVAEMVETLGEEVTVTTTRGAWRVSRWYIALHGLAESDVPALAMRYRWSKP